MTIQRILKIPPSLEFGFKETNFLHCTLQMLKCYIQSWKMSFTHTSVPLSVKPNSHTQSSRKKCAKFRNPHMGAHTHISPKQRMWHCKGKRTPSVILQQMMSNKSDDSITTNSQYETQVPWLLLNLLSSHCTQDPNCKVPMKLLELQLFQFISCNIPCLCPNKHTHTYTDFHCPQTTAKP